MRRPVIILILILLLSVVLRVAVAFYLGDVVDAPSLLLDQQSYHTLGVRLITGHGFSFDVGWYPFTLPNTPTAHWSFLYSFFVAAVYAVFGVHPLAVRLAQAVLGGILLPWVAYRLARRVFDDSDFLLQAGSEGNDARAASRRSERLALLTAGLVACYAYFILYAATLMTETFYMVALLWSLERALALRAQLAREHRIDLRLALTLGLSLGIATLLRQSILPWLAVLFVWLFWVGWRMGRSRDAVKMLALSLVPVVLLILPFTVRNYRVYGSFLLLNSNAGYAMYSAQHPMQGTHFQEFAAAPIPDEMWGETEAQMDRELMRLGVGFVLADPWRYVRLSLSRVEDYFDFSPSGATSLINSLGRFVSIGLMFPFMLGGLIFALYSARKAPARSAPGGFTTSPLALIVLFAVVYSAMHILTWAMPRYRLPVDAVMLIFVALALDVLYQRIPFRKLALSQR